MTQTQFFSFLGKALALAVVADQAYAVTKVGSPSTLLQPANFAALLGEVDVIFAPPVGPPAAIVPQPVIIETVPASPAPQPPAGVHFAPAPPPPPPVAEQGFAEPATA